MQTAAEKDATHESWASARLSRFLRERLLQKRKSLHKKWHKQPPSSQSQEAAAATEQEESDYQRPRLTHLQLRKREYEMQVMVLLACYRDAQLDSGSKLFSHLVALCTKVLFMLDLAHGIDSYLTGQLLPTFGATHPDTLTCLYHHFDLSLPPALGSDQKDDEEDALSQLSQQQPRHSAPHQAGEAKPAGQENEDDDEVRAGHRVLKKIKLTTPSYPMFAYWEEKRNWDEYGELQAKGEFEEPLELPAEDGQPPPPATNLLAVNTPQSAVEVDLTRSIGEQKGNGDAPAVTGRRKPKLLQIGHEKGAIDPPPLAPPPVQPHFPLPSTTDPTTTIPKKWSKRAGKRYPPAEHESQTRKNLLLR